MQIAKSLYEEHGVENNHPAILQLAVSASGMSVCDL